MFMKRRHVKQIVSLSLGANRLEDHFAPGFLLLRAVGFIDAGCVLDEQGKLERARPAPPLGLSLPAIVAATQRYRPLWVGVDKANSKAVGRIETQGDAQERVRFFGTRRKMKQSGGVGGIDTRRDLCISRIPQQRKRDDLTIHITMSHQVGAFNKPYTWRT